MTDQNLYSGVSTSSSGVLTEVVSGSIPLKEECLPVVSPEDGHGTPVDGTRVPDDRTRQECVGEKDVLRHCHEDRSWCRVDVRHLSLDRLLARFDLMCLLLQDLYLAFLLVRLRYRLAIPDRVARPRPSTGGTFPRTHGTPVFRALLTVPPRVKETPLSVTRSVVPTETPRERKESVRRYLPRPVRNPW